MIYMWRAIPYYYQIYFKTSATDFMKHIKLNPENDLSMSKKKTNTKLELLTDIDMLKLVEKAIRGGICNEILQHAKANDRHAKYRKQDKESSNLIY